MTTSIDWKKGERRYADLGCLHHGRRLRKRRLWKWQRILLRQPVLPGLRLRTGRRPLPRRTLAPPRARRDYRQPERWRKWAQRAVHQSLVVALSAGLQAVATRPPRCQPAGTRQSIWREHSGV